MNLVLVLLGIAVILGFGAGVTYRLLAKAKEVVNPFAREEMQLKSYEDALRRLEIKAQTVGYAEGDADRYAELIRYRNRLSEKLAQARPVLA